MGCRRQISLRAPDGGEARVVHASMRHNRDNILPDTPDEILREQIAPAPPLICVGHTHRPLIRMIDATLVVNAGSAGLPFDGDVRASYAQLTWQAGWQATIARVNYDRDQTKRDYEETGFMRDSGPIAALIYDEISHRLPAPVELDSALQGRGAGRRADGGRFGARFSGAAGGRRAVDWIETSAAKYRSAKGQIARRVSPATNNGKYHMQTISNMPSSSMRKTIWRATAPRSFTTAT